MLYYIDALRKYAQFNGRSRRSEYWYFVTMNLIIMIIIGLIAQISLPIETTDQLINQSIITITYYLITIIPTLAVSVRRMHDVGKSGWYLLIPVYSFILAVTEGNKGNNKYGEDPKQYINIYPTNNFIKNELKPNKFINKSLIWIILSILFFMTLFYFYKKVDRH